MSILFRTYFRMFSASRDVNTGATKKSSERAPEKNFKSMIAEKFSFCNTLKIKTVKVLYFDEKRKNMQERNGQIHSH